MKARYFVKFGKPLKIISSVAAALLAFAGLLMLVAGLSVGWFILFCASWPWMVYLWVSRDLAKLPVDPKKRNSKELSDILEGDILGLIPDNASPRDLGMAVMRTNGGLFFFARFGVSARYLPDLLSANANDTPIVYREMLAIDQDLSREFDPTHPVSAVTMTAALIRTSAPAKQVLATLRLDEDDLLFGAEWFAHLQFLIKRHSRPLKTGGIGRDWDFGYIPNLEHFGINVSEKYSHGRSLNAHIASHDELVTQMINVLGASGRNNVALIGQAGVGKETVMESFAETLMDADSKIPGSLRFNQVFQLDASSLIGAAGGRGQIESLVNSLMSEVYRAKNIILFLNHAELFFRDGNGAVDISNILQPVLQNGTIRIILALDEQIFLQISQAKPSLAADLNRLQVAPTDEGDTIRVLQDQIITIEFQKKVTFMYQAIKEAFRLSERYINDVAQPQKSIHLLQNATNYAQNGLVTAQSVVDAIEKNLGVKVGGTGVTDDADERDKLLNLEKLIHERMIDQVPAVNAVSAAIRRARAGVRNENRPIGTFLFLGPTGVGKTELAKSLAAVYFGDESHLISIDLNEYVRADDVQRLIADGATNSNSLTAQVMKQPFSVVLLDEIEKAHPNVLTALLQVLDEGVMLDINNKKVSFRDTILIATSNAGATRIRQYIEAGYQVEQFSQTIQDELINSHQFAPEFLNRFDEIVVFKPLSPTDLLQVVALILKSVNQTLAPQKVAVAVDSDAQALLVRAGYDPRLGARPLRRVVQRTVENIVSQKLLSGQLQPGQSLRITVADIQSSGGLVDANQQTQTPTQISGAIASPSVAIQSSTVPGAPGEQPGNLNNTTSNSSSTGSAPLPRA